MLLRMLKHPMVGTPKGIIIMTNSLPGQKIKLLDETGELVEGEVEALGNYLKCGDLMDVEVLKKISKCLHAIKQYSKTMGKNQETYDELVDLLAIKGSLESEEQAKKEKAEFFVKNLPLSKSVFISKCNDLIFNNYLNLFGANLKFSIVVS